MPLAMGSPNDPVQVRDVKLKIPVQFSIAVTMRFRGFKTAQEYLPLTGVAFRILQGSLEMSAKVIFEW